MNTVIHFTPVRYDAGVLVDFTVHINGRRVLTSYGCQRTFGEALPVAVVETERIEKGIRAREWARRNPAPRQMVVRVDGELPGDCDDWPHYPRHLEVWEQEEMERAW